MAVLTARAILLSECITSIIGEQQAASKSLFANSVLIKFQRTNYDSLGLEPLQERTMLDYSASTRKPCNGKKS